MQFLTSILARCVHSSLADFLCSSPSVSSSTGVDLNAFACPSLAASLRSTSLPYDPQRHRSDLLCTPSFLVPHYVSTTPTRSLAIASFAPRPPRLPARALSYDSAVANHHPPRRPSRILTHSPRHLSSYLTFARRLPYSQATFHPSPSTWKLPAALSLAVTAVYHCGCSEQCRPHLVSITKSFDRRR